MATVAAPFGRERPRPDALSGTPRAHSIDRWIFVAMAAWFIVIVLVGFIPDALGKVAAVKAGQRPPFPPVLHVHAVLMGSFLLLLLAQTCSWRRGGRDLHRQVGIVGLVLVPALVVVGFILAPTMYHQVWNGAHYGPPPVQAALTPAVPIWRTSCCCRSMPASCSRCSLRSALRARRARSRLSQAHDVPGDGGSARRGDRPDEVVADHFAGRARWRAISTSCWRCRRCSCGT